MRLQRYDIGVIYTTGNQLVAVDALSKATEGEDSNRTEEPVELHANMVVKTMPMLYRFLDHIKKETQGDADRLMLMNTILNGWLSVK